MTEYKIRIGIFILISILLSFYFDSCSGAAMNKAGATKVAGGLLASSRNSHTKGQSQRRRGPQSISNSPRQSHEFEYSSEEVEGHSQSQDGSDISGGPSKYALELFDLLAFADSNEDGEISLEEYSKWNTDLKFPPHEAESQFESMDRNKNGLVTLGEYYVWVRRSWTNSKSYIEQTFRDADDDLSGSLTKEEYLKWHKSFENTSQKDTDLEFLDYDKNQDGLITPSDFEMAAFMKSADKNGDGFLGLGEYLERTLKYLTSTLSLEKQRRKDELDFLEMDSNGDGFLSLRELEDDMY